LFPWSVYYIHNVSIAQAVICRAVENTPAVAYREFGKILSTFGDRFLVVFQEGVNGKPFFALSNPNLLFHVLSR